MVSIHLAAYAPNTDTRLGYLSSVSEFSAGFTLSAVGALTFSYPWDGVNANLLGQPIDIVAEVVTFDGRFAYSEAPNSRFLYLGDNRDVAARGDYQITCPGNATQLAKAVVGVGSLDEDGRRTFTGATIGAILDTLLTEAQARGALSGVTWDFTTVVDSSSSPIPWSGASVLTVSLDPGTDLLSIIQGWADAGLIDYRMRMTGVGGSSRACLQVAQATRAATYSKVVTSDFAQDFTSGVFFRTGLELSEVPMQRSWEGLMSAATVVGDNGVIVTRTAAATPWGMWETMVTAGGVEDVPTLNQLGDNALADGSSAKVQATAGLTLDPRGYLPMESYTPGVYVNLVTDDYSAGRGGSGGATPPAYPPHVQPAAFGATPVQVKQINFGMDANGLPQASLVLGEQFATPEQTLNDKASLGQGSRMARAATTQLPDRTTDTDWVAVSLGANIGNLGAPYRLIAVRKVGPVVYLRGVGAASGAVPAGNTICTLPAGYAPSDTEILEVHINGAAGRLDVTSAGVVKFPLNTLAAGNGFSLNASWFAD